MPDLHVFLPAAALVALSPGANNLLALVNGARAGLRRAVPAILGRMLAFSILVLAVSAGLGALLETSELAFQIVKWVGVGYLVYLGVQAWRAEVPVTAPPPPPTAGLMRREFWTAMTNPKAMLLFSAFLPQFVDPAGGDVTAQLITLGAVYLAVEFGAATIYSVAGAALGSATLSQAGRRMMNRISGGIMIGAAAVLARSERTA